MMEKINTKKLMAIFQKIEGALTKSEKCEFNKIRRLIWSGVDCFNEPLDNLLPMEKEGLESIRKGMELLGVFFESEETGKWDICFFGKSINQ